MFDDNAISSAVDDIVPEVLSSYLPKVDSEVQLLQLSSIGKYSYEDEKEGNKVKYIRATDIYTPFLVGAEAGFLISNCAGKVGGED